MPFPYRGRRLLGKQDVQEWRDGGWSTAFDQMSACGEVRYYLPWRGDTLIQTHRLARVLAFHLTTNKQLRCLFANVINEYLLPTLNEGEWELSREAVENFVAQELERLLIDESFRRIAGA